MTDDEYMKEVCLSAAARARKAMHRFPQPKDLGA